MSYKKLFKKNNFFPLKKLFFHPVSCKKNKDLANLTLFHTLNHFFFFFFFNLVSLFLPEETFFLSFTQEKKNILEISFHSISTIKKQISFFRIIQENICNFFSTFLFLTHLDKKTFTKNETKLFFLLSFALEIFLPSLLHLVWPMDKKPPSCWTLFPVGFTQQKKDVKWFLSWALGAPKAVSAEVKDNYNFPKS